MCGIHFSLEMLNYAGKQAFTGLRFCGELRCPTWCIHGFGYEDYVTANLGAAAYMYHKLYTDSSSRWSAALVVAGRPSGTSHPNARGLARVACSWTSSQGVGKQGSDQGVPVGMEGTPRPHERRGNILLYIYWDGPR